MLGYSNFGLPLNAHSAECVYKNKFTCIHSVIFLCQLVCLVFFLCTGGNVLVDETGQHVKLADFGTSVRCESFLQDNIPRGTEPFMSPEVNVAVNLN